MLIDLGEVRAPLTEAAPADGRRSLWRKVPLAIAVLTVLSAGAAAASPPPELRVVADVELPSVYGSIDFTGDAVIHQSRDAVSVYELDGRLRWKTSVAGGADGRWVSAAEHGLVLIFGHATASTHTTALDLADGRELWSFPGAARVVGDVIVDASRMGRYAVHDLATSALLWEAGGWFAVDPETAVVAGLARDGTLSERELRTGRIIRSIRIELPRSDYYWLTFAGRDIGIGFHTGGTEVDTSRSLIRLDRATFTVKSTSTEEDFSAYTLRPGCGQVRCEITIRGGLARTAVFDPGSGERLWEAEPGRHLQQLPSGLTGFTPHGSGPVSPIQVHDPRTGRVVRTISDWLPIRAGTDETEMAPVVLQEGKGVRPAHTFLARLAPSGPRILGSVRYEFVECKYHNEYLACMTVTRRLIMMKIKPAA